MTSDAFVDLVAAQPNGLGSVVAIDTNTRRARCRTCDSHAAHAIELLAARKGLKTLTTRPDDGSFVIGVTGFIR
jgi:hypothetical protein